MTTLRIQRQYRTYRYRDKNPVIDKMRTIAQDEGFYSKKRRSILHQISGVSASTFDGWWEGDTRNPQHHTIAAFITSMGYEEVFQKTRKINEEKELEAASDWRTLQNKRVERERAVARPAAKSNGKGIHR
jgi:hypothetical protein